jgi:HlyD family secretion protein
MKLSIQTIIWTVIVISVVIAGVMAFLPRPVEVEIAVAGRDNLRVFVQEDGKTRIRDKYVVSAPVAGRLSRIELRAGDPVDSLDVLLAVIMPSEPSMLDMRAQAEARARVRAAEASRQRAEAAQAQVIANHELHQKKFTRMQQLLDTRSISQEDYDIARTDLMVSEQAMQAAEFDTEIARYELQLARAAASQYDDSRDTDVVPFEIFTPIRGRVLKVFEESATNVELGTELIEIGDPANLEMEIDVLSTDAVRIRPGAELTVEHWGGDEPLRGHVRVVEPAAFTRVSSLGVEEQRVNIIADFDEPPERLAALGDGYRIEARITIALLPEVLQIPNSALFRVDRQWHVFTVVDGRAVRQPVELGDGNDMRSHVTGGLQAGDQVVVYPDDRLSDGVRVQIAKTRDAGPAP